ncbi:hypothetical protein DNTS_018372 [Danionella cerebrum]|uniref:Uncharacterized protein n=1 Tax=Danionella cerebrum TaxID=2873325 RepID=A0A553R051_9TELE|nr:hypothetical protein DNTS_018372 [Danionella translucida]
MSLKFPKNLARTHKSQVSSTAKTSCDGEDAGLTYNSVSCNNLKIDTHSNSSLKVRRLKTRKERNQIRCKQRQCKQRHMCHPCQQHISKDVGEKAQMHHMHRKEKPFVPQIQSIITEGRLTSTKGLFSHEIRSAKIDRILRERTKRNGQDEENTEKLMMPITPLVPPIGPVSDQDCSLNVEHEQENPPPHLKSSKDKFDQWRAAKQSEDGTRVQGHSIGQFFNQDISTLDGAPVLRVPFGIDPPVDLYSQNLFQSKDSGLQKKDFFNLTRIPQLWKAETGLNMNSFQTFDIRKQKPQETSARESNIWPHSSVVLNEREKHVPFSFSAAYLTEGFKYEPFFRCPHPSNTQSKSECVSMSRYLNLSTPFYSPHFL